MNWKPSLFLIGVVIVSGCADSGYVPPYIISHTSEEEVEEQKVIEQEETR
ncbi:MAG TPA: hypothetical protein VLG49_06595 [Rhabdochlamydiaceae bacterium]|nr:hypothetical protein [Rhabdochlamydiaceae bacterium]